MERNNSWFTIKPTKGVSTTSQSTSSYAQYLSGGKHARPGDLFRTPKAILERHQNGGKMVIKNPFDNAR